MKITSAEKILSQAEVICQQRSVRLTPQRLEVLRLMSEQNGAISAYDLLDLLRVSEPQAKPPPSTGRSTFCWSRGLFTAWSPLTAMWFAITLKSRRTLQPC